jgi:hypothetical protein
VPLPLLLPADDRRPFVVSAGPLPLPLGCGNLCGAGTRRLLGRRAAVAPPRGRKSSATTISSMSPAWVTIQDHVRVQSIRPGRRSGAGRRQRRAPTHLRAAR